MIYHDQTLKADDLTPNDSAVWHAFDHAAENYNRVTRLQHESADFLFALMVAQGVVMPKDSAWLDAGSGTGMMAKKLAAAAQSVYALDQSAAMLAQLHDPLITSIQADIRHLPFTDQSIGALVSHFALHWLGPSILPELCRVMQPQGVLWLAVPVAGSFATVHMRYPELPVFDFLPAEVWVQAAQSQAVEVISVVEKTWSQEFAHLHDLLHTLKLMGGHRLGRVQKPLDPARFRSWLRDRTPIVLEYRVLYMQLSVF